MYSFIWPPLHLLQNCIHFTLHKCYTFLWETPQTHPWLLTAWYVLLLHFNSHPLPHSIPTCRKMPLWHCELNCHLQHLHPIWAASLPIQLPNSLGKTTKDGPSAWALSTHVEDPKKLLASAWPLQPSGEWANGCKISLFFSVFVSTSL